ncbi:MAG: DNA gyrase subunit A [Marinilabiliaceae bacterium]|nr:DNA gyrase subunit A [Marinilabiliaceae bacterium]
MSDQTNNTENFDDQRIVEVPIEEQMRSAYIDYSMSVIVSRALPDVRDGFKPVHRRILYGMNELGVTNDKPYKKSARIVGDVLGKYHPHGDSSVYGALVRLAQPWAMRYMLVDGQGNFGSMDGDSAAAMRYTEARLQKMAEDMLIDIEKDTVIMQKNFDESTYEPTVLPTRIPNLLVNGSSGIAVGMATNMPTHNLRDSIDTIIAYIDNNEIEIDDLIKIIKAPDFPTGGIIFGYAGVKEAYRTGRGRVVIRAKCEIESQDNHDVIVVTDIPYNVNKAEMIKHIAELVNEKRLEGISNINDESDQSGTRVVIELKRDAIATVVLNHLYKYTEMQTSFGVNNIALVGGRPKLLNLKDIVKCFADHRHDVVMRRTRYELAKAEERAHLLEGLIIASDNIDEVVHIIRSAKTINEARAALMERFNLDDAQARYIVDMRLGKLTGLEQEKLHAEYDELERMIAYYHQVLTDESLQWKIIKDELIEIREKYADERRTTIEYAAEEFNPEDFYADDDMVITVSHLGYIKRTPLTEFRAQNRGGVGSKGSTTRDEDFIEHLYFAKMHDTMMFFTKSGRCFWYKVYNLPEGNKQSKGRALQNLISIEKDDVVKAFINVRGLEDKEFTDNHYIIMCTRKGVIKRSKLTDYSRPRTNGVIAITVREGDELLQAILTDGNNQIMMATLSGRAIRFHEETVRCIGRTGAGVKGVTLDSEETDAVVGFLGISQEENSNIFVLSATGFGKRSDLEEYRITNRGGKGVKTMRITEKTGPLVVIDKMSDDQDLMIINRSGITIRIPASEIKVSGRATQGVKLINLKKKNDSIASGAMVPHDEEAEVDTDSLEANGEQLEAPEAEAPETPTQE